VMEQGKEESLLTAAASGGVINDQSSSLLYRLALRLMAPCPYGCVLLREAMLNNRESANDAGLATSLIS
jgi:hypothetical protein